jgi:hypothetical protein
VEGLAVKAVESGELIRFTYRVVDPEKAKVFNDKKIEAFLDSPKDKARLVIPSLEKVGQLRQVNTPEAGRVYWMAFSNPRRTVRRGDHVNVVIGQFVRMDWSWSDRDPWDCLSKSAEKKLTKIGAKSEGHLENRLKTLYSTFSLIEKVASCYGTGRGVSSALRIRKIGCLA